MARHFTEDDETQALGADETVLAPSDEATVLLGAASPEDEATTLLGATPNPTAGAPAPPPTRTPTPAGSPCPTRSGP